MKYFNHLCLLIIYFMSVGCSNKKYDQYANIQSESLVVISHDGEGSLMGYMSFSNIDNISLITVLPSEGKREVYVTVLGRAIHPRLSKPCSSVSSEIREGCLGYVRVTVKDGLAVSVGGNRIQFSSPIKAETLTKIDTMIAQGDTCYPKSFHDRIKIETEQVAASDR